MLLCELFKKPAEWESESVDRRSWGTSHTYGFILNKDTGETFPANSLQSHVKQSDAYKTLEKKIEKKAQKIKSQKPDKEWINSSIKRMKELIQGELKQEPFGIGSITQKERVLLNWGTLDAKEYVMTNLKRDWNYHQNREISKLQRPLQDLEYKLLDKPLNSKNLLQYSITVAAVVPETQLYHIKKPFWEAKKNQTVLGKFSFLPKKGLYDLHFDSHNQATGDYKSELTGTGHAIKVMATVKAAAEDALSKPDVEHLLLSARANEPSRVKLYHRMIGNKAKKRWKHKGVVYWLI